MKKVYVVGGVISLAAIAYLAMAKKKKDDAVKKAQTPSPSPVIAQPAQPIVADIPIVSDPVQEIVRVPVPAFANPETYTPEPAPELEKGNFGYDPEPIGNLNEGYGWKEQSSWGVQANNQYGANTQYYPSTRPAYMNNGYRPEQV